MCCGSLCPVPCAAPRQPPENPVAEALSGLLAMMVLAFLRIPIALSMGIVGIVGYAYMRDWNWAVAFATAQTKIYETGRNYTLSVIPLFILMGNFVTRAGMSQDLFRTAYAFVGHLRGGLAMATIVGCAGFGAICGSSIATAATFARVAYPEMKKFGYADYLATGSIAARGAPPRMAGLGRRRGHRRAGRIRALAQVQRRLQRDRPLRPRDGRDLRRGVHRHRGRGGRRLRRHDFRAGAPRADVEDALCVAG